VAPKSSNEKPHLGSQDFNEGPEAASRFLSAARHIFKAPSRKPKTKPTRKNRKRD
jgi:hypothetical protein